MGTLHNIDTPEDLGALFVLFGIPPLNYN